MTRRHKFLWGGIVAGMVAIALAIDWYYYEFIPFDYTRLFSNEPSYEEIEAACAEIGETRNMDGARRIQILRELGVPGYELRSVNDQIEKIRVYARTEDDWYASCHVRLRKSLEAVKH